ncbi:MAG: hypothetical protein NTX61_15915 [Bacteroidetes bacterium]|nr:hypothetical protein [Bacteroidota bacterium]
MILDCAVGTFNSKLNVEKLDFQEVRLKGACTFHSQCYQNKHDQQRYKEIYCRNNEYSDPADGAGLEIVGLNLDAASSTPLMRAMYSFSL